MCNLFVSIIVVAIIFYVLWWGLGELALGAPFDKVLRAVLIVGVVIYLVSVLTGNPLIAFGALCR